MLKRTITGFFILLVTAGFILLRMVHISFFDVFVLILMIASGFEMIKAKKLAGKNMFEKLIILYPLPVLAAYVFSDNLLICLLVQMLSILCIFVASVGIELVLYGIRNKTTGQTSEPEQLLALTKNTMSIIIYPMTVISSMFMINHFGYNIGYIMLITVFAVTMTTDTFAYLFGMWLGKKGKQLKLAPDISPKKSIAGFVAGVVGGFVISIVCWLLFYHYELIGASVSSLSTIQSLIMFTLAGILGSLATQFGDLLASAVKRQAGLKDYGKLLPGHGGVMDRIDGLMFSSVAVSSLFMIFMLI